MLIAACLVYSRNLFPLEWQVAAWSLLLVVLAVLSWRGWERLLGPVFFYDLSRSTQRGQQNAHRWLYAGLLVVTLFVVYWSRSPSLKSVFARAFVPSARDAEVAQSFFFVFMELQLIAVLLLTPLYTAGAVADERERRTLELLFVTDLSNREIIMGLLGARVANLISVVLTGLPILSFLQFLGGVDPNLVLAVFAATITMMLSLGSLSILVSVSCRTSLGAVILAYLLLPVFVLVSPIVPLTSYLGSGSLLQGSQAEFMTISSVYGFAHVLAAIFFAWLAAVQLRAAVRPEFGRLYRFEPVRANHHAGDGGWGPYVPAGTYRLREEAQRALGGRPRRAMTDNPLMWKESYVDAEFGAALGLIIAFLCLATIVVAGASSIESTQATLGETVQPVVRGLGTCIICVMLVIIAMSAAGRVSRERERQTLDNLLTIPAERSAILFAKWLASILLVRRLWFCLAGIWAAGVLTGALNFFAVPLLAAACIVYMTLMASMGLWFSTLNRSILRASLFTLLAGLSLIIVPFATLSTTTVPPVMSAAETVREWKLFVLDYGLNPIGTLWVLNFRGDDIRESFHGKDLVPVARILAALAGLHFYLAGAILLCLLSCARLRAEKGPRPRRRPAKSIDSVSLQVSPVES
jgi:ABC-type transport system involved in multi-copper enzyme maturation permease subunit